MNVEIGERRRFRAVYCGGDNPDYVCLVNVTVRDGENIGQLFRDHTWVERSSVFDGLPVNTLIEFSARVIEYETRVLGVYVSETHGIRCRVIGKKYCQMGLKGIRDVICEIVPDLVRN